MTITKNIEGFLLFTGVLSGLTLLITFPTLYGINMNATESTKTETILKKANLSDLQSYFENELGIDDIAYNEETKKVIIDTNESSYVDNIVKIDKRLAKNDKIKSVDFTRAGGKGGLIILIINLK